MKIRGFKIIFILICMFLAMAVWPFALIRDTIALSTSMGIEYHITEKSITDTDLLKQTFEAQASRLEAISIALNYEENLIGILQFELLDQKENVLVSQKIPATELVSGVYYEVPVGKWLKKGELYTYQVAVQEEDSGKLHAMYSEGDLICAPGSVSLVLGEENVSGQAVTSYKYGFPMGKKSIISIWAFFLVVMIVGNSLLDELNNDYRRRKNNN